jgi:hypothetical protein
MCTQKVFGRQKRNKNVVEGFMQNFAILSTNYAFYEVYIKFEGQFLLLTYMAPQPRFGQGLSEDINPLYSISNEVQGPKTQGPDIAAHAICPPEYWSSLV